MLLVLVALVVGFTVGLVALATQAFQPDPAQAREVCSAEVADPGTAGGSFRAELAPDQTAYAALVVGVAHRRGLPARAATIGVATAIQESGLRNIDYGDRDSLGLFQQRPSQGWGTEEQVQDPLYSTAAFYDGLEQVDGYTELDVTVAAQRVQRSGFPDAYADHEGEGRALASALYGLAEASLTCDLRPLPAASDADRGPGSGDGVRAAPAEQTEVLLGDLQDWGPPGWTAGAVEPSGPGTPDGTAGVVVGLDARGASDPDRSAWALAHSVVAMAGARDVVRVQVDGLVWDRDARGAGWTEAGSAVDEAGSGGAEQAPPAGTVRVWLGQRWASDT